jgi:aminopeptidase YwaD
MIALIDEIIGKFGPRPAGSEAEKNAQLFIQHKCAEFTNKTEFIPFEEHLNARFGKLKYYVVIYVAALILYNYLPVVALVISFINAFFIIFDLMMYRDILTKFPGKKEISSNVEATLEPQGETKSTLIISAHMDSTREYTWWYKLGETGVKLTVLAGVLMVLQPLFLLWHLLAPTAFHFYIWLIFVVLTPITVVYWSMHAEEGVPGAQDNLSGIAIAFETVKQFADPDNKGKSILKNTRLKFLSFGSEEKGLCGSRAYASQKAVQLKNENTFLLNIDSVRLVKEVAVVRRELMNGTKHSPMLVAGMLSAFEACKAPCKTVVLPIGGTDAVSFARAGIPGVSIIGISTSAYDFTYHTRHDIIENIEPAALNNVKAALSQFIRTWDDK